MDNETPCLILDITDAHAWEGYRGAKRIDEKGRPSVLQTSLISARSEAQRLGREHPGRTFGIFQIVEAAIPLTVPSRVTFHGEPLVEHVSSTLVEVGPEVAPF
ncbi:hypothetical protein [Simplicispira suum]|uniref:Uncharacterized protein n=1 Tax=Simplicispira suum TaxID=2109915 RepID=A0A2S0N652_9BURK|nr:hypothetical protein [Simplicispira suum]AVO43451.1 hypothetical protein C6571_18675 [Simplicispira suum]